MPAITREYLDAMECDDEPLSAADALNLRDALRRIIDVRDAAVARGRAAEAEAARGWGKAGAGLYMTVIDADEITGALERNV